MQERTILEQANDRYHNPFIPNGFTYVKGE